jgi:hypothetical protein
MSAAAKVWGRTPANPMRGIVMRKHRLKLSFALMFLCSIYGQSNGEKLNERALQGQVLHDQICRGCHEDNMYTERHLSRNPYFDLRMQTRLWSEVVKVKWSDAEIDDVVYFLQQTYYADQALTQ